MTTRDDLAALIGAALPITDRRPYGDQTESGEVFVEGAVELLAVADSVLAAGWREPIDTCGFCLEPVVDHTPTEAASCREDIQHWGR